MLEKIQNKINEEVEKILKKKKISSKELEFLLEERVRLNLLKNSEYTQDYMHKMAELFERAYLWCHSKEITQALTGVVISSLLR